jgi:hypothetical protein
MSVESKPPHLGAPEEHHDGEFGHGMTRSSHYVNSPQGARHDADIARLESGHRANLDLGKTTEPDQDSHDPGQPNYDCNK